MLGNVQGVVVQAITLTSGSSSRGKLTITAKKYQERVTCKKVRMTQKRETEKKRDRERDKERDRDRETLSTLRNLLAGSVTSL